MAAETREGRRDYLPRDGRLNDTILFIGQADVPANAQAWRGPVQELLRELQAPPAVVEGMHMGTGGTELSRKYRRAIILIYCALYGLTPANARRNTALFNDINLPTALGNLLLDVQRSVAPQRLTPRMQELFATPAAFLAHNRIKTGRSNVVNSISAPYRFTWDSHSRFFLMEPLEPNHTYLHVRFQGFNIAVTSFNAVQDNLGAIPGVVVTGNIGLTTQLSGCSIMYSVNGANLVAAHIWPENAAAVRNNLPEAIAGFAAQPAGAVLALRLAHEGGLDNAIEGGTNGIFGMVHDVNDLDLRLVNGVRTHGYHATRGNAYFIAVAVDGNWRLYGVQNNPGRPHEGVSEFRHLNP